ncbi:MAG: ATP-binding protein [Acidobacteriota bacterium]
MEPPSQPTTVLSATDDRYDVESKAWRETFAKSRRGLIAFPAGLALAGGLAGQFVSPSLFFLACAFILLATTALRATVVWPIDDPQYARSVRSRRLFSVSVVLAGCAWGLFSAWLVARDPWSAAAFFAVLTTVAVMGQAVVIYSASFGLTALQQVALALPHLALWSYDIARLGDREAAFLTLGALIYTGYCLSASHGLAREQRIRLERTEDLQVARELLEGELARRATIQRQITEELRERELDYQKIFQQAHDAILIFEPTREIVLEANERATSIYGYSREELVGLSLLDISVDVERGQEKIAETLEKGAFLTFATQQRRKDGTVIDLEINASVIEYRGETAILSVNRDVTDRNRADELRLAKEAAERASRTKSLFLANMSHEIRTPMAGIIGLSDLLCEADLPPRKMEWARTLHASAESLLLILDDVLDLSKIEDDHLELNAEPFHLETEVLRVVELTRSGVETHGLDLDAELADDLPRHLVGDAGRLRQVLLNLLGNAAKFTTQGTVRVAVATTDEPPIGLANAPLETSDSTVWLEIIVRDSGIGIAPEHLERIFEPFTQADASTTRRFGGTGLGLTICRRLVQLLGGSIDVSSTPGEGSTFRVVLPFALGQPEESDDRDEPVDGEEVTVGRGRVLLVEDNEVNRIVALAALDRLGVEAEAVGDGRAALERLAHEEFDLVLMDVQMPSLDGLEATRRLRALEAESHRNVPVVALTAHAYESDRLRCLAAGMNDYLAKPVRRSELAATLERWLAPRDGEPALE